MGTKMNPIDYSIDVKSPFDAAMEGYKYGLDIRLQQEKEQAAARLNQQALQMQQDLGQFSSKVRSGAASADDYAGIIARYPALSEHFKRAHDVQSEEQQRNTIGVASQVFSALQSGQEDIAKQLVDQQRQAAKNSGNAAAYNKADALYKNIDADPRGALNSAGMYLASVMGPKDFSSNFGAIFKTPQEAEKLSAEAQKAKVEAQMTPQRLALEQSYKAAEIRNLDSQVADRANQLGLKRDDLQSNVELKLYELKQKAGELPESAKKIINDTTVASTAAAQAARQSEDLANRLEAEGMRSGVTAKGAELYKSLSGNQDAITQLRQEYTRIRSQGVIKMMPPGNSSDKDVTIFSAGFPEDTASPQIMAQFLRGLAKVQNYEAISRAAEAEWVNSVGHMGKPKTDITVDGISVPAGTTFADFSLQYLGRKAEQQAVTKGQSDIQSRPYMKYANPGAQ
jgi:hypothetical protein